MKLQYINDYEETLTQVESSYMPQVGISVFLNEDEWIVTKVYWDVAADAGIVQLIRTDEMQIARPAEDDKVSGRLDQLQASIMETNRSQDELRKKHRGLRDQVSSVRGGINRQAHKERKST